MLTSHAVHLQHLRTLKMTPQLRQAIGLLQFSNRSLAAFLAIQASSNPYLKILTAGDRATADSGASSESGSGGSIPKRNEPSSPVGQPSTGSDWRETEDSLASPAAGLYEYVRRQVDIAISDQRQKAIAYFMTEALEPSGWLGRPLAKIAAEVGCSLAEAETVLSKLQGFEPTGIFARSLAECLRLQAIEQGILSEDLALVLDNLEIVGRGDIDRLARLGRTTPDSIMAQVKAIRRLNPKPGAAFDSQPVAVLPPDLVARKVDGDWQVELNRSNLPAITVRDNLKRGDLAVADVARRDQLLAEARWLEKAVARRNVTTLTVAAEIVRRQSGFLVEGPSRLEPMSIADVAAAIGVHDSTVSRVTSGLLMETPRGSVGLRDFFSVGLAGENGGSDVSATAVRDEIRRVIGEEDADRPISDQALAAHFKDRGITVARRTVAKYRDILGIPGSAERKRRGRLSKRRGPA